MMRFLAIACALPSVVQCVLEAQLVRRDDLVHKDAYGAEHQLLRSRWKRTVGTNIFWSASWAYLYYLNVTVGSPPQQQTVVIDTGSADTVVIPSNSTLCQGSRCSGGSFDRSKSVSNNVIDANFTIEYADGTMINGIYVGDTVGIGNVEISNVQFAIGADEMTDREIGLFGLGYSSLQVSGTSYPQIVDFMARTGVIKSRLFSLYMGPLPALQGSILFGGIDTTKYTGPLATVNFFPSTTGNSSTSLDFFTTFVTDGILTANGQSYSIWENTSRTDFLLDSGTSAWYLPNNVVAAILQHFPGVDLQTLACPCEYASSGISIQLTFAGKINITIDASEFVLPSGTFAANGTQECVFLIASSETTYILGTPVLRSMYVVFDMDNGQASFAQAAYNATERSNIIEVQAGPSGLFNAAPSVLTEARNSYPIPSAPTGISNNAITALATPIGTATGLDAVPEAARLTGVTYGTPLPLSTSSGPTTSVPPSTRPTPTGNPNPTNVGAIAGGVVGGVAGAALVGALLYFLIRRRKTRSSGAQNQDAVEDDTYAKAELHGETRQIPELEPAIAKVEAEDTGRPTETDGHVLAELDGNWRGWEAPFLPKGTVEAR